MSRVRAWATASKLRIGLLIVVGAFLLISWFLRPRSREPARDPGRRLGQPPHRGACDGRLRDCHSNLTTWPFESNIAPTSWLIQRDVDEGRGILNFSEWDRPQADVGKVTEVVQEGEMPPLQYKILHPGARLSDGEKAELVAGLTKTYQQDPPGP